MLPRPLITRRFRNPFVPLLVMTMLIQVGAPFIERSALVSTIVVIGFMLTCFAAVQPSLRLRIAAISGFIIVLGSRFAWLWLVPESAAMEIAVLLTSAVFIVFIAINVLRVVISHSRVTVDTISGAICVYLLMAQMFALLMFALEISTPGSISGIAQYSGESGGESQLLLSQFLYFSFITLTTLGYGEIIPVNPAARSIVMLEAVCGQFFLAVFVARLVGSLGSKGAAAE